jgi:hypothetical protein
MSTQLAKIDALVAIYNTPNAIPPSLTNPDPNRVAPLIVPTGAFFLNPVKGGVQILDVTRMRRVKSSAFGFPCWHNSSPRFAFLFLTSTQMFLCGGYNPSGRRNVRSSLVYNYDSDTLDVYPDMLVARRCHGIVLISDTVMMFGGSDEIREAEALVLSTRG